MKSIFVTGGAGFIGSAFVRLLLEEDLECTVVNYDALTYAGNPDNLVGLDSSRHRFVRGDITQREAVLNALDSDTDAIVHFAAESHVDRSIASADAFLQTNVLGTQVLLDAARARRVPRFLFVSTDEVMGSLPLEGRELFTEDHPFQPNSPYAASKAAAEHLARAAFHTFGLPVVTSRCGNNYGPRQFPEKLIPLVIANALQDQPVPVYGDGLNVRDWIYVEDHCRALYLLLQHGCPGEVYNVGARNPRSNLEVIHSILAALRKPASLIRFIKDRPGHDRRYDINPAKLECHTGWQPRESWVAGLEKTIAWYRDNSGWIARVRDGGYREYYSRQYADAGTSGTPYAAIAAS